MAQANYIAVDQDGQMYHALGPYPRKELLQRLGRRRASKMYIDTRDGRTLHVGYVIAGLWLTLYEVKRFERPSPYPAPARGETT
jgi:hypothetical protein